MKEFDFFMIFYSILLGIAITEIFSGFGGLLRRDRIPQLGLQTPLIGLVLLVEIMSSFIDAWDRLEKTEITLLHMSRPTSIGILYYLLASIVVPRDDNRKQALDDYFAARRKRIGLILIIVNLIVLTQEPLFILDGIRDRNFSGVALYVLGNIWLFGAYITLWRGTSRCSAVTSMLAALLYFTTYYVTDITGLFAR